MLPWIRDCFPCPFFCGPTGVKTYVAGAKSVFLTPWRRSLSWKGDLQLSVSHWAGWRDGKATITSPSKSQQLSSLSCLPKSTNALFLGIRLFPLLSYWDLNFHLFMKPTTFIPSHLQAERRLFSVWCSFRSVCDKLMCPYHHHSSLITHHDTFILNETEEWKFVWLEKEKILD